MNKITDIHQNYDAGFKEAFSLFKDKSLDFLGFDDVAITEILATESTEVMVKKTYSDLIFKRADDTGLHLEWEVDISSDDILRFAKYNIDSRINHKISFETIIFTRKKSTNSSICDKGLVFKPTIVNLVLKDGDSLLEKIKNQIAFGVPINELELIYLPLYNSKYKTVAEMLKEVVELTNRDIVDIHKKEKILLLSALISNKFITEEDYKIIWEAIKVMVDEIKILKFAKLDGKEEGIKIGEEKSRIEIAKKLIKMNEDVDKISALTELSIEDIGNLKKELD